MDHSALAICAGLLCMVGIEVNYARIHPTFVPQPSLSNPQTPFSAQAVLEQQMAETARQCAATAQCVCQTQQVIRYTIPAAVVAAMHAPDVFTRRVLLDALVQQTVTSHYAEIKKACDGPHASPTSWPSDHRRRLPVAAL